MQQKPKTAAEYQAEMMQLYRRAHPAQETISESQPISNVTDTGTTSATETNALPSTPDLPPISTPSPVPASPAMSPENLPPELTEATELPKAEPLPSDIIMPPEPEPPQLLQIMQQQPNPHLSVQCQQNPHPLSCQKSKRL